MHQKDRYLLRKTSEDFVHIYIGLLVLLIKFSWFIISLVLKLLWRLLRWLSQVVSKFFYRVKRSSKFKKKQQRIQGNKD